MLVRILLILFCFICCSDVYSYPNIYRDSEVEIVIKELAQPIFTAAGVDSKEVRIFVVDDNLVNAYVTHDENSNNIFINLGLLKYSTEPYVLLGVLAHEIAHVAAGHLLQWHNAISRSNLGNITSIMLGLISSIVVSHDVGTAVLLGGVTLNLAASCNYSEAQEIAADSYALRYLDESRYDNIGLKELFSYYHNTDNENTELYFRTHPLSSKRLFAVRSYKVKNDIKQLSKEQLLKFKRIVVKIDSLLTDPIHKLLNKYSKDDSMEYVNAIVYYRQGMIDESIAKIDYLLKQGNDPHLYGLKADVLYKAGRIGEAIENYEKLLEYLPNVDSGLVKLALSHVLLLHGDVKRATLYLEQMLDIDPNNHIIWKYLSVAYKDSSDLGMHYFALAKLAFINGKRKKFIQYAELAANFLQEGSPYLLQIEDMRNTQILKARNAKLSFHQKGTEKCREIMTNTCTKSIIW